MSAAEAREPPGLWLRRQRVAAGLTQEDLAERSGVSVRAIADLERGRTRKPYPSSVRALTHALGMPDTASTELVARYRSGGDGAGNGPAAPATDVAGAIAAAAADGVSGDVTAAEGSVPRQLPTAVPHFAGRASELDLLDRALDDVEHGANGVVISVIGGTAGVGKTALALHWAHRVSGPVPGRAALRQPAGLRLVRPSGRTRRRATRVPRRAAGAPRARPRGHRGARGPVPEPARRPEDARAARQRRGCRPGAAAAARVAGLPRDRDQPPRDVRARGARGCPAAEPGRAQRGGGQRAAHHPSRGGPRASRADRDHGTRDPERPAAAGAVRDRRPRRRAAPSAAGRPRRRAHRDPGPARRARRGRSRGMRPHRVLAVVPAPSRGGGADVPPARPPSGPGHQRARRGEHGRCSAAAGAGRPARPRQGQPDHRGRARQVRVSRPAPRVRRRAGHRG